MLREHEIAGSKPATPTRFLRVAQLVAHVLWEHGVGSSNLSAETNSFRWCVWRSGSAPECEPGGRRFDPDHAPQTNARLAEPADAAASKAVAARRAGSSPASGTSNQTPRGGIGRRTGLRCRRPRACPFESDRGDQHQRAIAQMAESSTLIRCGSVVRIHLARPAHALSSDGRAPDSYSGGPRFEAESAYQMKGRKRAASVTWL